MFVGRRFEGDPSSTIFLCLQANCATESSEESSYDVTSWSAGLNCSPHMITVLYDVISWSAGLNCSPHMIAVLYDVVTFVIKLFVTQWSLSQISYHDSGLHFSIPYTDKETNILLICCRRYNSDRNIAENLPVWSRQTRRRSSCIWYV